MIEASPLENTPLMVHALPLQFPVEPIVDFYQSIAKDDSVTQICLTHRPGQTPFIDGCGSSYNPITNQADYLESDFTETAPGLPDIIQIIIQDVRNFSMEAFGRKIGRIRFMRLKPKTCLSYHVDYDPFRLHIPVIKDKKSFFVVNDQVCRMPNKGQLYFLRTNVFHTAVNASLTNERVHLVFNTCD